jgi:hypothetical protein
MTDFFGSSAVSPHRSGECGLVSPRAPTRFDFIGVESDRVSKHEAGHIVAAHACGLSVDGATIDPTKAPPGAAGCVFMTPGDYSCGQLETFSEFSLHELRCEPLPKIDGQPLGDMTSVLLYAKIISLVAPNDGDHDMLAATIISTLITAKPAALLDMARADAASILAARKHQVEAISDALIACRTLDGAEIAAILSGRSDALQRKRWDATVASAALFTDLNGGFLEARWGH